MIMQQQRYSSSHWKKLIDGRQGPWTDHNEPTRTGARPARDTGKNNHRTSWNSPNQHHDPTTPKHTHPNANKSPKPLKCPKRNNSRFFKSGNCENSFLPVCIVFGALFFNDCFKIYVITRTHCSFIIFKVTQIFSAAILLLSYKQVF